MSFELFPVFGWGGGWRGSAMRQAIIHQPLTSEARVQSQEIVCEIYVGRSAIGTGFP